MIISGSSHVDNSNNGVDSESEKNNNDMLRLLSLNWFISGKHARLIIRLCTVVLIHTILFFDSHVRGMSIAVGIIIFNIGEDWDFAHNPFRMC